MNVQAISGIQNRPNLTDRYYLGWSLHFNARAEANERYYAIKDQKIIAASSAAQLRDRISETQKAQ